MLTLMQFLHLLRVDCICLTKILQVFPFLHAKARTKKKCTSIDTHNPKFDTYWDLRRKKTDVD